MTLKRMLTLFGIILGVILLINVMMMHKINEDNPTIPRVIQQAQHALPVTNSAPAPVVNRSIKTPPKVRYQHIPQNPDDYGIIVRSTSNSPRSAQGWEVAYRDTIKKLNVFEGENAELALTYAKTKPEDFQKEMERLKEHISIAQDRLAEDPLDKKLEDQLQLLYKLKAIGEILKDKVISETEVSPLYNDPAFSPPIGENKI